MLLTTCICLGLATLSNALIQLLPPNHEFTYKWQTTIQAGTYYPTYQASKFGLKGNLHLQTFVNSIVAKITNLSYQSCMETIDHNHEVEVENTALPEATQDLSIIFKIVYDSHGLATAITSKTEESEFSRNIKRAIAGILQMNNSVVSKTYHHPHSFVIKENSIYGRGDVVYSVSPGQEAVEVIKMNELSDLVTELGRSKQQIVRNSKRKYILERRGGGDVITHITATGEVTNQLQSQNDQFIFVNQTFDLIGVGPTFRHFHLKFNHSKYDLTYAKVEIRHVVDYQTLIPLVQEKLRLLLKMVHQNRIDSEPPDVHRMQVINEVRDILAQFTFESLNQLLRNSLQGDVLSVFYDILPLVGTEASTLLVKRLVIQKMVSDSSAVHMLQHLSDTALPTVDLLHKLEELTHLNNSFDWSVRKMGILCFGTFVHKLYTGGYNDMKLYKKYIKKYAAEMETSTDYKLQAVYILGLRNMRLPDILKYLVPAFNGELWSNEHLRLLSLFAAAPVITTESVMETLWPVLTNRDELTEIRVTAYCYVIQLPLSRSILKNLMLFMLDEPDQELYHFHYTYVKSVIKSKDPRLQDLRRKLSEIDALTPPPTRGISSADFYGYQDDEYHLSAGFVEFFMKTNRSRLYGLHMSTLNEEYTIFVKVHNGLDQEPGLYMFLMYMLMIANQDFEDTHVEVTIVKQGQVFDFYCIDGNNSAEVDFILEVLNEKYPNRTESFLDLTYNEFRKFEFPSDVGLPVYWEFIKPDLHYVDFNKTKHSEDGIIKYGVDIKYLRWLQYREGLSCYNPFKRTKHGIHRFSSYELLATLNLDLIFHPLQGNVSFVYKKQTGGQTLGVRSFGKQVLFVDENYTETDVQKLNTLFDHDDFNTGHKLYVAVDSKASRIPLKEALLRFVKTDTKHFNLPLHYVVLILMNLQDYAVSSDNLVLTLEPSRRYDVQSISVNGANTIDIEQKDSSLQPLISELGWTLNFRNRTHSFQEWSLISSVNINFGHTVMNMSANLSRRLDGKIDCQINARGIKEWKPNEVVANLTLSMDTALVSVDMTGQRSLEQKQGRHKYKDCQYIVPYSVPFYYSLQCVISHTSVRHYVYNIKTRNLSNKVLDLIDEVWDHVKGRHISLYSRENRNTGIEVGTLKVELNYPMQINEADVHVATPGGVYNLTGIPRDYWNSFGLFPDSLSFPKYFMSVEKPGYFDYCVVTDSHYTLNNQRVPNVVSREWQLYTDYLYMKKLGEHTIVAKATNENENETLEIFPDAGTYRILLNGRNASLDEEFHPNWIAWQLLTHGNEASVAVFVKKVPILFVYDAKNIIIVLGKRFIGNGQCYHHLESRR